MSICEYCGGVCRKVVRLVGVDGSLRSFDCVECALAALYPACESCGHAIEPSAAVHNEVGAYCSAVCAGAGETASAA